MNRIIQANIGGVQFSIDDRAYEELLNYLRSLERHFEGTEGKEEIIGDIEMRIAEMLSARRKAHETVTLEDSSFVISTLGKPEEMADASDAHTSGPATHEHVNTGRRLYRDGEDNMMGGVCSGISYYFGWDPVWLRLAFVLSVFLFFGTGLLLYVILWIVIPEANTPTKRMEMKGEPVTLDSLKRKFQGEADRLKKKYDEHHIDGELHKAASSLSQFGREFGRQARGPARNALQAFGKLLGVFLLILGLVILFGVIVFDLGIAGVINLDGLYVPSPADVIPNISWRWLVIGASIVAVIIPLAVLFIVGFSLVFGLRWRNKKATGAMAGVWVIALGVVIVGLTYTYSNYDSISRHEETQPMPVLGNTLVVKPLDAGPVQAGQAGKVQIFFHDSDDDQASLGIVTSARGDNHAQASASRKLINYKWQYRNDTLYLAPNFTTRADKWSAEQLKVDIYLPGSKDARVFQEFENQLQLANVEDYVSKFRIGTGGFRYERRVNAERFSRITIEGE